MGFGVSFFLLAVGAILTFAVHVSNSHGFDINTIGVILMVVGALGLVCALTRGVDPRSWQCKRVHQICHCDPVA